MGAPKADDCQPEEQSFVYRGVNALRLGIGLVAALGLALPSAAAAQRIIPPGNSGVNQYTEPFPTPGGSAITTEGDRHSPAEALGARNARRLERLGPDGRAAAGLIAATAPVREGAGDRAEGGPRSGPESAGTDEPGGSSALSEVVGQATGLSSLSEMGLLLPLVIVGAVVGSLAYLWRRQRRTS